MPGKSFVCPFFFSNPVLYTAFQFPKPVNTGKSHCSPARGDVSGRESPRHCWTWTAHPRRGFFLGESRERAGWCPRLPPGSCPQLRHVLTVGSGTGKQTYSPCDAEEPSEGVCHLEQAGVPLP